MAGCVESSVLQWCGVAPVSSQHPGAGECWPGLQHLCSTSAGAAAATATSSDSRLKHSFWDIFGENLHILKRSFKAVSVAMATLCSVSA